MAAEWYYLENGDQRGPIAGSQLKIFAESGEINPTTPVRRILDGQSTPWTRAGAIKALYPHDVVDQLGPPICDQCGTVLSGEVCPKCCLQQPLEEPIVHTDSEPTVNVSLPVYQTPHSTGANEATVGSSETRLLLRCIAGLLLASVALQLVSIFYVQEQPESAMPVRVIGTVPVDVSNAIEIETSFGGLPVEVQNSVVLDTPISGLPVDVQNSVEVKAPSGGLPVEVQNSVDVEVQNEVDIYIPTEGIPVEVKNEVVIDTPILGLPVDVRN